MRYSLLFLGGFILNLPSLAQNFRASVELGINASQIDGDDLSGYNQAGLRLGAQIAYPLDEKWELRSGMVYSGKGSRHGQYDPDFLIWRLNYLEMPLVMQYALLKDVSLTAGFTANYLIQAKQDVGFGFEANRRGFRDFDFCYTGGVVYQPFDNAAFAIRIINALVSASPLQFYRNRSLAFSLFYQLGSNK